MKVTTQKKLYLILAIVIAAVLLAEMILAICKVIIVDPVIVAVTVLALCLVQTLYRNAVKAIKENSDFTDTRK